MTFVVTPKALANLSPGLERQRQPWDLVQEVHQTLKGFVPQETLSGFKAFFDLYPGLSLALQPWAEVSQRLRRLRLTDEAFSLPPGAVLIHIYTTSPLHS